MREAIARLPDGVYEYAITSDGFDEPVTARGAAVTIDGDSLLGRLHRHLAASRRGINVVMNYTHAYTTFAVKVHRQPRRAATTRAPSGVHRITAPEGCILNAQHPRRWPRGTWSATSCPHAVAGALKQALPDRVMAEGSANIWGMQLSGKDRTAPRGSTPSSARAAPGARPTKDGLSATAFPSGVLGTPVEVIEIARAAPDRAQGAARRIGRRRPLPRRARPGHRLPGALRRAGHLLRPLRPHASPRRDSSAAGRACPGRC